MTWHWSSGLLAHEIGLDPAQIELDLVRTCGMKENIVGSSHFAPAISPSAGIRLAPGAFPSKTESSTKRKGETAILADEPSLPET